MERQVALLVSRLSRLSYRQRLSLLYRLRDELDEESFRALATLAAMDLSIGDSPRRWRPAEDPYELAEDPEPVTEEPYEPAEVLEAVEEEYVGSQVVSRLWRSST